MYNWDLVLTGRWSYYRVVCDETSSVSEEVRHGPLSTLQRNSYTCSPSWRSKRSNCSQTLTEEFNITPYTGSPTSLVLNFIITYIRVSLVMYIM